ncbi:type VII secretion system-associated protein [Streptomyces sp.]|uniref:type VII secretion system-associated protein n=1 Tax=Streptomyces sp. TaxID=1931 RepID=UPI002F4051C1
MPVPDLTALDAPALTAFINNEVAPFQLQIVDLRTSHGEILSLYDLAGTPQPLLIGQMATDGDTSGKDVVAHLVAAAKAIDTVLNKHQTAFSDLKRELEEVIRTMLKTQGDSLAEVEGQKFLTAIGDYNTDIGGSSSSTTRP